MILFNADSKVQKDRAIMRETDSRMAKYSGRGLIFNVMTYLLCLATGQMLSESAITAMVLTLGLIIFTLVRGFILVRFDALYDRGPSRWRTLFFIATLLGASWWSVILVVFTLRLGLHYETPLLWFYTVVFFASTVHVTSPFKRFSRIYLVVTLLPATCVALYVGEVEGYMYSLMMLIFIAMLYQMINNLSDGYWGKLEANYALKQKTIALEMEKRDIDASVDLNAEFLTNLGHEFRTSLNDILGGLALLTDSQLEQHQQELLKLAQKAGERQLDLVNNIVDFSRISNRTLVLDHSVFNLRSYLEQWLNDQAVNAHQQGVELDYDMHPSVPLRANGDVQRIGQVVKNLLSNAIQFSEQGDVFVDFDFKRESEQGGHLEMVIIDRLPESSLQDPTRDISDSDFANRQTGLWFTICKGLAECMDGTLDIDRVPGHETYFRFRLPLNAAGQQPISVNSNPRLRGKRVLVVCDALSIGDFHWQAMLEWGLLLDQVGDFESASQALIDLQANGDSYDLLLINLLQDNQSAIEFSMRLLSQDMGAIPQIYMLTHNHLNDPDLRQLIDTHDTISYHYRPILQQEFHDLLAHNVLGKPLLQGKFEQPEQESAGDHQILLVDDHRVNQMVAEGMLKKLGYRVRLANNGFEALEAIRRGGIDLILMDCQMPEMDGFEATRNIRKIEDEAGNDEHIPIIAMTAHATEGDQSQCLACGMDDYMTKPVRYDALQSQLLRWLGAEPLNEIQPR